MTDKIVQLVDKDNNNVYPVAGSLKQGSVTTSTINDGAVTAAKLDAASIAQKVGTDSGSDQNYCIKYPDGTMIAVIRKVFNSINVSSSWGSLYEYEFPNGWLGNYAVDFIVAPAVTINAQSTSGALWITNEPGTADYTKTPGNIGALRPTSSQGITGTVSVIAIGKWK